MAEPHVHADSPDWETQLTQLPGCQERPPVLDAAGFLAQFHPADSPIYFRVGQKTWKNKPQTYEQSRDVLAWRNSEGDDIFFVVSSGGTTISSINRISSVFLDWDAGKIGGHYLPLDEVEQRKLPVLEHLNSLCPETTASGRVTQRASERSGVL